MVKPINTQVSDDLFADLTAMQTGIFDDMNEATDALGYQIAELEVDFAATVGDDDGTNEFDIFVDGIFGGDDTTDDDLFGDGAELDIDDIFGV